MARVAEMRQRHVMGDWEAVAGSVADDMLGDGAVGVALMGSYARGDAHALSDVDIVGLGEGRTEFRETNGVILSLSWVDPDSVPPSFEEPDRLIFSVPGWRTAIPLRDPYGRARELRNAALEWRWSDELESRAAAWLASEVVGYCEEVFGLVRSLDVGNAYPMAVIRSVFALRSARLIAARYGLLYESEKELWTIVAAHEGDDWRNLQETAFGLAGESLAETAKAGLLLYRLVVEHTWDALQDAQRAVVAHALQEIERVTA